MEIDSDSCDIGDGDVAPECMCHGGVECAPEEGDEVDVDVPSSGEIITMLKKYGCLSDEVKSLESQADSKRKELNELEYELFKVMFILDLESMSYGGKEYTRAVEVYPSIRSSEREKFFDFLSEHGSSSIIKTDVNPKTLQSWYKKFIAGGGDREEVVEMLNIFEKGRVKVKNKKSK